MVEALPTVCSLCMTVMMPRRLTLDVAILASMVIPNCCTCTCLPALTHGRAVPGRLML